jgi:hypothetical protein
MQGQSAQFDLGGNGVAVFFAELDRRQQISSSVIEATVEQPHSTSFEDYRARLIARIADLYSLCEFLSRKLGLAQLLGQSTRPSFANGAQILAAGPDVEPKPPLHSRCISYFTSLLPRANSVRLVCPSGWSRLSGRFATVRVPLANSRSPGRSTADLKWLIRGMPGSGHGSSRRYSKAPAESGSVTIARVSLASCWLIWIALTRIEVRTGTSWMW